MKQFTRGFGLLALFIIGCQPNQIKPDKQLCMMAEAKVRQNLGPEFRRVTGAKLLFDQKKGTYGCGIVYQMIAEELAEEFDDLKDISGEQGVQAALLSRLDGQPSRLVRVQRSRNAPGPVRITLETHEVTGDAYVDLFVLESARREGKMLDYQALKIVNGNPEESAEILELPLLQKSKEGPEVVSAWEIEEAVPKGTPVLTIRGTNGVSKYRYDALRRMMLLISAPAPKAGAESKADGKPKAPKPTPALEKPALKAPSSQSVPTEKPNLK